MTYGDKVYSYPRLIDYSNVHNIIKAVDKISTKGKNINMARFRVNPFSAIYHLIKNDVHELEYDPRAQFEFHRRMSGFWILNGSIVLTTYFLLPHVWHNFSVLYLVLVSLYANFATDYGAMPGSHAAVNSDKLVANQSNEAQF